LGGGAKGTTKIPGDRGERLQSGGGFRLLNKKTQEGEGKFGREAPYLREFRGE